MAAPSWAPSLADVHALTPTRGGRDPAGWGEATAPTAAQVEHVVEQVTVEVLGHVGRFDPDAPVGETTLGALAAWTVALGAAALVEQGAFPEQNNGREGLAESLRERYAAALGSLARAAADAGGDSTRIGMGTLGVRTMLSDYVIEHPLVP